MHNPSKIIGRTKTPILEPKELYERFGDVNIVVFPTGACVVDNDKLFVYYGAADKVCNHSLARDCTVIGCSCCSMSNHMMVMDGMQGFLPAEQENDQQEKRR